MEVKLEGTEGIGKCRESRGVGGEGRVGEVSGEDG